MVHNNYSGGGTGNKYDYFKYYKTEETENNQRNYANTFNKWHESYAKTDREALQVGGLLVGSGASIGLLGVGGGAAGLYKAGTFMFKIRAASSISDVASQWYSSGAKNINVVSTWSAFVLGNPFGATIPGAFFDVAYNSIVSQNKPIIKAPDQNTIKSIGINTVGNMIGDRATNLLRAGFLELGIKFSAFKGFLGQSMGDNPAAEMDKSNR